MSGAIGMFGGAFDFTYGFLLALLREWFYPVMLILLLIAFFTIVTALKRWWFQ